MQGSPALTRLRRLRGISSLVVLGLLCRALIPDGFMPAPIGAGGPVVVCHGGPAGEFFRRLEASRRAPTAATVDHGADAAHADHADRDAPAGHDGGPGHGSHAGHADSGATVPQAPAADHEAWEHCPFGAAFGAALLAADVAVEIPVTGQALDAVEPLVPVPFRPVASYRARAPPSAAIHS